MILDTLTMQPRPRSIRTVHNVQKIKIKRDTLKKKKKKEERTKKPKQKPQQTPTNKQTNKQTRGE